MYKKFSIINVITVIIILMGIATVHASEISGTFQSGSVLVNSTNSTNGDGVLIGQISNNPINTSSSGSYGGSGSNGSSGSSLSIGNNLTVVNTVVTDTSLPITCQILKNPMRFGKINNQNEVIVLQKLLNNLTDSNIPISGVFDQSTHGTVKTFQALYRNDILIPWGVTEPTGYVYITTLKKLNEINCKQERPLTNEELSIINANKVQVKFTAIKPTVKVTKPFINIPEVEASEIQEEVGSIPVLPSQTASAIQANTTIFERIGAFFRDLFGF